MQTNDRSPTLTRHRPSRPFRRVKLVSHPQPFLFHDETWKCDSVHNPGHDAVDVATLPMRKQAKITLAPEDLLPYEQLDEQLAADLDISSMSTITLMQLSGEIQAIRLLPDGTMPCRGGASGLVEAWRPETPQQSHVPPGNYTPVPFGISLPLTPVPAPLQQEEAAWRAAPSLRMKVLWNTPAVKMIIGGMIGIVMLLLVSRFVDVPTTFAILRQHLVTPQGLLHALLASLSFFAAFSIRGTRWKLFLQPITKVSVLKAIQIYWVGIFINVLLPVQGGEVVKSLLLKRVTGVPVSRSLPTVAMDKSLDLLPALVILAIVPFIPGIHMSPTLWLILALVSSILIGVVFVVGLTAWNRAAATAFMGRIVRLIPGKIGKKIEGFAMGFVDSLLAGASRPKTFLPAVLLTCAALTCDGLFAMFAFWTVGVYMNFGQAIFGYTIFNMFTILPTPPGQVGSNEIIGTLVFGGLLGFNKAGVLAMFVFSHPLTALIMATMCGLCLSALGLNISSALRAPSSDAEVERTVLEKMAMKPAYEEQWNESHGSVAPHRPIIFDDQVVL